MALDTIRITKSACLYLLRRLVPWQRRLLLGRSERAYLYLGCKLRKRYGCVCHNRGLSLNFHFGWFYKGWANYRGKLGNDKLGNHSRLICLDFRLRLNRQSLCRYQRRINQPPCYYYNLVWFDDANMHQACDEHN